MKRIVTYSITFIIMVLAGCSSPPGPEPTPASGSLDTGFGSGGMVISAVDSSMAKGESIAIQNDGKIVVAGYDGGDFFVIRYNSNGTLDTSFGAGGKVTTSIGSGNDEVSSVAIHDGKIVVAGYSNNGSDYDFAVVRYTAAGALDPGFDTDGKVTTSFGADDDKAYGMAIKSDGTIVVVGLTTAGTDELFAIACYTDAGALDTSFSADGMATAVVGTAGIDTAYCVAIQDDGKIVVAGSAWMTNAYDFAVVRYTATGALDTSFDTDGKAITDMGTNHDYIFGIAIQGDGKIVAAGETSSPSTYDIDLARYTAGGVLDTTFGTNGKVKTTAAFDANAKCVAIQGDGKIVIAGSISNESDSDFAVVRYLSDGALDTSFDSDGIVTTDINSYQNTGRAIALQNDGKIVIMGNNTYLFNFYAPSILRYNP
jgi:uncharacterized delta-60 repeat protein